MMMLRGEKHLEMGKNDKAVCHDSSQSTIFRSVPKAKFRSVAVADTPKVLHFAAWRIRRRCKAYISQANAK